MEETGGRRERQERRRADCSRFLFSFQLDQIHFDIIKRLDPTVYQVLWGEIGEAYLAKSMFDDALEFFEPLSEITVRLFPPSSCFCLFHLLGCLLTLFASFHCHRVFPNTSKVEEIVFERTRISKERGSRICSVSSSSFAFQGPPDELVEDGRLITLSLVSFLCFRSSYRVVRERERSCFAQGQDEDCLRLRTTWSTTGGFRSREWRYVFAFSHLSFSPSSSRPSFRRRDPDSASSLSPTLLSLLKSSKFDAPSPSLEVENVKPNTPSSSTLPARS